jgi:hypothetical protein
LAILRRSLVSSTRKAAATENTTLAAIATVSVYRNVLSPLWKQIGRIAKGGMALKTPYFANGIVHIWRRHTACLEINENGDPVTLSHIDLNDTRE